jgi:hypothetical protein
MDASALREIDSAAGTHPSVAVGDALRTLDLGTERTQRGAKPRAPVTRLDVWRTRAGERSAEELRQWARRHAAHFERWPVWRLFRGQRARFGHELQLLARSADEPESYPRDPLELYAGLAEIAELARARVGPRPGLRISIHPYAARIHATTGGPLVFEVPLRMEVTADRGLAPPDVRTELAGVSALSAQLTGLGLKRTR